LGHRSGKLLGSRLLDPDISRALERAVARSYAPYSGFRVAVVLRDAAGRLYAGSNVENVSYPLCICAERVALLGWRQERGEPIEIVYIYTDTTDPTPPCGLCRDALLTWAPQARVVLVCREGASAPVRAQGLLPAGVPESRRSI
jgi:cytidine deaminase